MKYAVRRVTDRLPEFACIAGGSHSFLGPLCCLSAPPLDRVDSMSSRQRHSATLQQLLAWEKKLYKDAKVSDRTSQLLPALLLLSIAKRSHDYKDK